MFFYHRLEQEDRCGYVSLSSGEVRVLLGKVVEDSEDDLQRQGVEAGLGRCSGVQPLVQRSTRRQAVLQVGVLSLRGHGDDPVVVLQGDWVRICRFPDHVSIHPGHLDVGVQFSAEPLCMRLDVQAMHQLDQQQGLLRGERAVRRVLFGQLVGEMQQMAVELDPGVVCEFELIKHPVLQHLVRAQLVQVHVEFVEPALESQLVVLAQLSTLPLHPLHVVCHGLGVGLDVLLGSELANHLFQPLVADEQNFRLDRLVCSRVQDILFEELRKHVCAVGLDAEPEKAVQDRRADGLFGLDGVVHR